MNKLNGLKTLVGSSSLLIAFILNQSWIAITQWEIWIATDSIFSILENITLIFWSILTSIWVIHKIVKKYMPWGKLDILLGNIDKTSN